MRHNVKCLFIIWSDTSIQCTQYLWLAILSPGGSSGKASVYKAGDPGSIPGSGRSAGEGNGNPLQYCCLENPMEEPGRLQSMGSQKVGHN